MYGAGDVRVENVPDARIKEPTDALLRITRACICGSDLWPYKTMEPTKEGRRMGHEFIGVVEDVGKEVRTVKRGDLVVVPYDHQRDDSSSNETRTTRDRDAPPRFAEHRQQTTLELRRTRHRDGEKSGSAKGSRRSRDLEQVRGVLRGGGAARDDGVVTRSLAFGAHPSLDNPD